MLTRRIRIQNGNTINLVSVRPESFKKPERHSKLSSKGLLACKKREKWGQPREVREPTKEG